MSQRYAFIAEWLDPNSGVLWRYQLFYYKDTNELEMVRASVTKLDGMPASSSWLFNEQW
jgi:hypothetical protein